MTSIIDHHNFEWTLSDESTVILKDGFAVGNEVGIRNQFCTNAVLVRKMGSETIAVAGMNAVMMKDKAFYSLDFDKTCAEAERVMLEQHWVDSAESSKKPAHHANFKYGLLFDNGDFLECEKMTSGINRSRRNFIHCVYFRNVGGSLKPVDRWMCDREYVWDCDETTMAVNPLPTPDHMRDWAMHAAYLRKLVRI